MNAIDSDTLEYRRWLHPRLVTPALVCIWLLIYSTISAPEDYKAEQYGTEAILSPRILELIKLISRLLAIGITSFGLLSLWRHPRRAAALSAMLPWILFTLFGVLSVAWSAERTTSIKQIFTFGLLILLATYIGTVWRSDRDTRRLIGHLATATFLLASSLLLIHFLLPSVAALTKSSSGVFHSTSASAMSGLSIVLTLCLALMWRSPPAVAGGEVSTWDGFQADGFQHSRSFRTQPSRSPLGMLMSSQSLWIVALPVHLAVMIIGGNRLSFLVTAAAVAILMALYVNRILLAGIVMALSTLGTVYITADPRLRGLSAVGESIGLYARQGQSSRELSKLSGREEMWTKVWDSYLDSPIWGHGYFVTSENARLYVWYEWGNWTAHNFILQILATTGIIGLLLVIFGCLRLVVGSIVRAGKIADAQRSARLIAIVSVWFLGWGILNESFVGPLSPESVVFSTVAGIAAGVLATPFPAMHPFSQHTAESSVASRHGDAQNVRLA